MIQTREARISRIHSPAKPSNPDTIRGSVAGTGTGATGENVSEVATGAHVAQ